VAALDWATWHLFIRPTRCHVSPYNSSTTNQFPYLTLSPATLSLYGHLPRHPGPRRMLTSACATCHPSSGDTCHFQLVQPYTKSAKMHDTCHAQELPRVLYGHATSCSTACHVSCTDCTDRYSQHHFFTCLARRTDLDNFSIRTPFAKINIPPESGERDGRNGTVFVAFRAL
jgi:hypothetical protein